MEHRSFPKVVLAPRQPPAPAPAPREAPSTYLAPADPFPTELAELELDELQVLHSRACRRLEDEYRTSAAGPHPITLDRVQELVVELDTRQEFLAPPEPSLLAGVPVARDRFEPLGTGTPGRDYEHFDELFRFWGQTIHHAGVLVQSPDRLQPGDGIDVWDDEGLQCTGCVDESAPALGVVWIRDEDGYRRMFQVRDVELRYRLRHERR